MNHHAKHTAELLRQKSKIWSQVKEIPGILGLSIGLKETRGQHTEQLAWRIYVKTKLDSALLNPKNRIPRVIYGLPTDIIQKLNTYPAYGQETVKLLRPGVQIESNVSTPATFGCFAIRDEQPDKIVMLSNSHVIYGDSASIRMTSDTCIGQPTISSSWCSMCRVIGTAKRADATKAFGRELEIEVQGDWKIQKGWETDCAIADFNKTRNYTNDIEKIGMITGTPPSGELGLNSGDSVKMMASVSGYVTGKVLTFKFDAKIVKCNGKKIENGPTISKLLYPFATEAISSADEKLSGTRPNVNQFCFIPDPHPKYPNKKMYFCKEGDSGAVIVNSQKKVVALLIRVHYVHSDTAAKLNPFISSPLPAYVGSIGIASPIHKVLDTLNIKIPNTPIQGTKVSSGNTIAVPSVDGNGTLKVDSDLWLSRKVDEWETEMRALPLGRKLVDKIVQHRQEVFNLVNYARHVTVVWHRCQGPAFVAHCLKSITDPNHEIPFEIEGISRELLIKRMSIVLKEYGSEALSRDIDLAYPLVIQYINQAKTIRELVKL